jgi:hypothetical protein
MSVADDDRHKELAQIVKLPSVGHGCCLRPSTPPSSLDAVSVPVHLHGCCRPSQYYHWCLGGEHDRTSPWFVIAKKIEAPTKWPKTAQSSTFRHKPAQTGTKQHISAQSGPTRHKPAHFGPTLRFHEQFPLWNPVDFAEF